jgi:internalin A
MSCMRAMVGCGLLVVWFATAVRADEGERLFPDKNLEAVVRQYVFEKRNNDEPLVEDDVKNISTIVGKNKGIKSLTGLEKCRSLALLDLAGNKIQDIAPLAELKNLQSLDLSRNQLQSIQALGELTGLQYLHLAENQLRDVSPLEKLENLRTLYLSKNELEDISAVANLKKLWSLYVEANELETIEVVSGLKDLSSLDLRGNEIRDLEPLRPLTELRYLMLDNTEVADLTVLVEMAQQDAEGEKRFAPFIRIYLTGNPLSEAARGAQLEQLRQFGCRVTLDE